MQPLSRVIARHEMLRARFRLLPQKLPVARVTILKGKARCFIQSRPARCNSLFQERGPDVPGPVVLAQAHQLAADLFIRQLDELRSVSSIHICGVIASRASSDPAILVQPSFPRLHLQWSRARLRNNINEPVAHGWRIPLRIANLSSLCGFDPAQPVSNLMIRNSGCRRNRLLRFSPCHNLLRRQEAQGHHMLAILTHRTGAMATQVQPLRPMTMPDRHHLPISLATRAAHLPLQRSAIGSDGYVDDLALALDIDTARHRAGICPSMQRQRDQIPRRDHGTISSVPIFSRST